MDSKVYAFIDEQRELALELQRGLTARPAVGPESGGEGEEAKARWLAAELEKLGFPAVEWIVAPDPRVPSGGRPNLACVIPGRDKKRTFWIVSHLDVVPPGDPALWEGDPFRLRQAPEDPDLIFGRGVEDNQQGVVSAILAGLACLRLGLAPACNLGLLFVADEESNSAYGVDYILRHSPELFSAEDLVLVPDFGNEQGSLLEVAEKSVLWLKFSVQGKQCHGSTPEQGVNSLVAASALVLDLDRLHELFPERNELFAPPISTFAPTKTEGNVPNVNTIPGLNVFYLDCRILPVYTLPEVLRAAGAIAADCEKRYGVKVTLEAVKTAQAAPPTPPDSLAVRRLYHAVDDVYGVTPQMQGIGGATVANFFRELGLSAVVWARIISNPHTPNEHARLSYCLGDAKAMAHMALEEF